MVEKIIKSTSEEKINVPEVEVKNEGTNEVFDDKTQENKPPFAKKPAKKLPQRSPSEFFIMHEGEKIELSFPAPKDSTFPDFQRAVGMAEGTVVESSQKGKGIIEIDGFRYDMKENRNPIWQKRYPLNGFVGKPIKFTFYPTITLKGVKILKLEPEDPPFIKIANLRKEIPKQGMLELIGTIGYITKEWFTVSVRSKTQKKEYITYVFGKCPAKPKDFVIVNAVLKEGLVELENMRVLKNIKMPERPPYNPNRGPRTTGPRY